MSYFTKRIIIGGPPRTGSTLLRFILDCSNDIVSGPESGFFLLPLSEHQRNIERTFRGRLSSKLEISKEIIFKSVMSATTSIEAFDGIMDAFQKNIGIEKSAWAEKSPRNCYHYPRIAIDDDDILFLSIIRNGLDIVTSVKEKHHSRPNVYWCPIQRYVDSMRCIYAFDHPRHHIVRYEDMVGNPEQFISELAVFLNINIDKNVLKILNTPAKSRDTSKITESKLEGKFCIQNTWIDRWRQPKHNKRVNEFLARDDAICWLKRSGYRVP